MTYFLKTKLNTAASTVTIFGAIAHIGLCTIDFIMTSYGNNDLAREQLSQQITNTPSILYPFVIVGPSLLFLGLSLHALNFIKTNTVSAVMVILGALSTGFSFFIMKNGIYMLLSCMVFCFGLGLLLFRNQETLK